MDLTAARRAEVQENIKRTIGRLSGFQLVNGGLSYWPGEGDADEWGTNYAGHFMLAAQAKGYTLPVGFIDGWKKYQKQKALNWAPDAYTYYEADLTQAYRLYLLAMAHVPELGAMNRLKEYKFLSEQGKWRLAAAYKLAGQPEVALQMIKGLGTTVKPYNQMFGTYGSDLRDEAMILETLTLLGQRQKAAGLLQSVAADLSQDSWYSTQTTAYSLLAIAQYSGQNRTPDKLLFNYQAGKVTGTVKSGSALWQMALNGNGGQAMVKNTGKNMLYLRLIQQGTANAGAGNGYRK
jgi:uncharacterized protein YfaS (alpha-2-macroglobulin family)